MANYSELKQAIASVVKANNNQEITGNALQNVLMSMVNALGNGYQFMGIAIPSTNPGTPDQNVFYIAAQAGTYTNFSAIVLQAGISIISWNGSWSSETFIAIDATPTIGSNNLVKSNGIAKKFYFCNNLIPNMNNFIQELYILPQYLETYQNACFKYYGAGYGESNGSFYLRISTTSGGTTYLANCRIYTNTIENGNIYELKSSGGSIPDNTVFGYIIFKNVESVTSAESYSQNTNNVIVENAQNLSMSPQIASHLALLDYTIPNNAINTSKIANGAVTTPKIADGAVTTDKMSIQLASTQLLLSDGKVIITSPGKLGTTTSTDRGVVRFEVPAMTFILTIPKSGNQYTRCYGFSNELYDGDDVASQPQLLSLGPIGDDSKHIFEIDNTTNTYKYIYVCYIPSSGVPTIKVNSLIDGNSILPLSIGTQAIKNNAITPEKLDSQFPISNTKGVKVVLPNKFIITTGSRLQLFHRGFVKSLNPYEYNVEVSVYDRTTERTAGMALPRYYELPIPSRYIFTITDGSATSVAINASFVLNGTTFTVKAKEIVSGSGTLNCSYSAYPTQEIPSSGSFTISGNTVNYSSVEQQGVGTYDMTVNLRRNDDSIIDSATCEIKAVPVPLSNPQKNILMFGASVTSTGYIADELRRRLTLTTGTIDTPTNPKGLGQSNIAFIGRTVGYKVTDIHQEATGGWGWGDFATAGTLRYRFYITDGSGDVISVNDTFTINGLIFTVKEKNITAGNGNISCTYTGTLSQPIPTTGSFTVGGYTVNYSDIAQESLNPFYNPATQSVDFANYSHLYCADAPIHILISHLGVNDMAGNNWWLSAIKTHIKTIARAYKSYCTDNNIDGVFIISSIAVPDPNGGMGWNYNANCASSNYYMITRRFFDFSEAIQEIVNDDEFSSFVRYAPVMQQCDAENMYPREEMNVNNRATIKEWIGVNAYHPNERQGGWPAEPIGYYMIADAIYQSICDALN